MKIVNVIFYFFLWRIQRFPWWNDIIKCALHPSNKQLCIYFCVCVYLNVFWLATCFESSFPGDYTDFSHEFIPLSYAFSFWTFEFFKESENEAFSSQRNGGNFILWNIFMPHFHSTDADGDVFKCLTTDARISSTEFCFLHATLFVFFFYEGVTQRTNSLVYFLSDTVKNSKLLNRSECCYFPCINTKKRKHRSKAVEN